MPRHAAPMRLACALIASAACCGCSQSDPPPQSVAGKNESSIRPNSFAASLTMADAGLVAPVIGPMDHFPATSDAESKLLELQLAPVTAAPAPAAEVQTQQAPRLKQPADRIDVRPWTKAE